MWRFGAPQPVFSEGQLKYNPTNEWIFPSVVGTAELAVKALGQWYMYYSPHDPPGGICLAYANHPMGPWTEYAANPVIGHKWAPHYDCYHVASPHALWVEEEKRLFVWFHGDNPVTRWATTEDGVHFEYGGVAVSTAMFPGTLECSYGRVFRHRMPSKGNDFVFLLEGNLKGRRVMYLAWSTDAKAWTAKPDPFLLIPEELGGHGGSPWLMREGSQLKVVSNAGRFIGDPAKGDVECDFAEVPVTEDLVPCGPHRVLHAARRAAPDFGRVSDFCLVTDTDGRQYVFYNAGRRLKGRIQVMPVLA